MSAAVNPLPRNCQSVIGPRAARLCWKSGQSGMRPISSRSASVWEVPKAAVEDAGTTAILKPVLFILGSTVCQWASLVNEEMGGQLCLSAVLAEGTCCVANQAVWRPGLSRSVMKLAKVDSELSSRVTLSSTFKSPRKTARLTSHNR